MSHPVERGLACGRCGRVLEDGEPSVGVGATGDRDDYLFCMRCGVEALTKLERMASVARTIRPRRRRTH